jgi:uncharacterized protein YbaP (TraB family)
MKKLSAALILCFFAIPLWADNFDMAAYLKSLNRYYFCFSTVGIKSFQAQASVSISGQLPKGIAEAWQGFGWQDAHPQFDFSYVGAGVMPIMTFSSNDGNSAATPERMRKLSNMANSMLKLWGIFVATPLFEPPSSKASYQIARNNGAAFTIIQKGPKSSMLVDYDSQSLAKKITFEGAANAKEIDLQFFLSNQGALPERVGLQFHSGPTDTPTAMDLVVQYQSIQGFELPSQITLYQRSPGQLFQVTFTLSNYAIERADQQAPSQDNGDTQLVSASSESLGAKHFFWRVKSPTATVYLLGSIHLRPHTPLQLPEVVENGFEASNYVGFEFDLSKKDEMERDYPDYVQDHCTYPPGDDLTKHLTLGQWKFLELIAAKANVPVAQIRKLKPYVVDDYLARMGSLKTGENLKKNGIDEIFFRKAQKANKPVFGMEFWYEPLKVLDSLPEPEQIYYLFGSSGASSNLARFFDEILADWKTGNTVDLESLTYNGLSLDGKAIMDKVVQQRNQYWVPQMDRILLGTGTYFIVVGSAHLVGPNGLPSLLALKGYTVEQL